ncbi:AfsR/SARP family transcriptional regulator [Streptomyces durbertensis]|uniref:AfsR/SARP family transcriptional regulator n=1 Tax=Streptomyces durbertensis TaxID=2448886 RepID=A0ABR6E9I6_9ACTN|nr:BTAD domain-containing putative transcriptional regulator [Streptomyces durbertensis]MBB1242004.1 AfsR/SARP family transcriptional regulator [Streptomyces durbertensis]
MDINLLGSLAVCESGTSITPTAPKPRQLLAVLALHADQTVPVQLLVEELWGDHPPRTARNTLQSYVLQLRTLIERALERGPDGGPGGEDGRPSAKDVLATLPGGYRLDTRGGVVDIREFEERVGCGYAAMARENYPDASRRLRDALGLWRGDVFADVRTGPVLEMEIRRLEETRLCALDQRVEADFRLGRHRELVGELTVLASRYRMHESLHRQLMLALHHSGRRGEALAVYQRLRATLVRELGLEPSPRVRRIQQSILAARAPEPVTALLGVEELTRAG